MHFAATWRCRGAPGGDSNRGPQCGRAERAAVMPARHASTCHTTTSGPHGPTATRPERRLLILIAHVSGFSTVLSLAVTGCGKENLNGLIWGHRPVGLTDHKQVLKRCELLMPWYKVWSPVRNSLHLHINKSFHSII